MNKELRLRLALLSFPLLVVIIAIYLFIKNSSSSLPQLLQSTPPNESTNASVFAPLTLTYNQILDPSQLSASSIPEENWSISSNGTKIILNHSKYLHANKHYELNIYYQDKLITTLSFKTNAEQNDPRYLQTVQEEMDKDYPLATSFPHETNQYRVVYSAPLTLQITLKTDLLTDEQAIEQIRSWVEKNGGDPDSHKYTVIKAP